MKDLGFRLVCVFVCERERERARARERASERKREREREREKEREVVCVPIASFVASSSVRATTFSIG